jgi:putative membrane protein
MRGDMVQLLLSILISAIAVFVTAQILPGVHLDGFGSAIIAAIVLGVVNAFIKPILLVLTLPINILTLGLFTLVIIALCVMLVSALVPGFKVEGFWYAMIFGLVLSLVSWFLNSLVGPLER